ncbi:MAG: hypothetical protein AB7R00_29955 [Kofleriaceae bacterium]
MNRLVATLVFSMAAVGAVAVPARGQGLPAVGDPFTVNGAPAWGRMEWLYDVPSLTESAGKVVIHWFCSPKVTACPDDLARIVTLKENGRVYIVAHISGTKKDAKKLDPIRESEGVGQGSVSFGRNVISIMKQLGITGPVSVVVDVNGKVAHVATGSTPQELDARDAKVNALVAAIKDYTTIASDSPKDVMAGAKFTLSINVSLAKWLKYSAKRPAVFTLTAPPDFKCDAKVLKGDQLKIVDHTMTAQVTCTAPKGSYEARGDIQFGYQVPGGGDGIGKDGAKWKFTVKP